MQKVSGEKIERLRGRLIAQMGRNVEWKEFARICNLTPNTVANLRSGRSQGTLETLEKIVGGLRGRGLDVSLADLLV
jgi:transcriptional regulator with XRE-family HTH domain